MLKLFVEWNGPDAYYNVEQFYFRCSSCGMLIEDARKAFAIFPARPKSLQEAALDSSLELNWTIIHPVHDGACFERSEALAQETYKKVGHLKLHHLMFQLLTNTRCFDEGLE